MNYHITCSSAILCSFLATGCSTLTKKQTKEVSTTAIAYTGQLNDLLEITKTRVIDLDSKQLTMIRASHSEKEKKKKLKEKDELLDKWITLVNQLRDQNIILQNYFKTLQSMVEAPEKNDMHDRLGAISQTISEINKTEAGRSSKFSHEVALTDEQVSYVSSISKSLISRHYSAQVKRVLLRDRNIINRQIALHDKQLKAISSIYKRRAIFSNAEHYRSNVLEPFVGEPLRFNAAGWAANRRQWFDDKQAIDIFDDVKKANKAFREAWLDILQGKKDVGAVSVILGDVNQFVDSAQKLRRSYYFPADPMLY